MRIKQFDQYCSCGIEMNKNSRPDLFCKKGALKNFSKLTGKIL